jgi:hypothetical protein
MISVDQRGKILVIKLLGELEKEHLEEADRLVEEKLEESSGSNVLLDLRKYHGSSDLSTAWQEFKLVTAHGDRVEKIAVVGSFDWQKLATLLVSPFTKATERFFEPDEVQEAMEWLRA